MTTTRNGCLVRGDRSTRSKTYCRVIDYHDVPFEEEGIEGEGVLQVSSSGLVVVQLCAFGWSSSLLP